MSEPIRFELENNFYLGKIIVIHFNNSTIKFGLHCDYYFLKDMVEYNRLCIRPIEFGLFDVSKREENFPDLFNNGNEDAFCYTDDNDSPIVTKYKSIEGENYLSISINPVSEDCILNMGEINILIDDNFREALDLMINDKNNDSDCGSESETD